VAGLRNYLQKEYDNLITFDFVCRGTNSPKAYIKYIEGLENIYRSKIKRVWFKNKTYGWNRFSTRVDFMNGKKYIKDRFHDLFMRGYIEENLYMRDCCFQCKYKNFPRQSDITLADFWGVGIKDSHLDQDKGTSLIMINTAKGNSLFELIKGKIVLKEMCIDDTLSGNGCILQSAIRNPRSNEFLEMLDKYSFDDCFRMYARSRKKLRGKVKFLHLCGMCLRKLKLYDIIKKM
jgi:hypothetical protein